MTAICPFKSAPQRIVIAVPHRGEVGGHGRLLQRGGCERGRRRWRIEVLQCAGVVAKSKDAQYKNRHRRGQPVPGVRVMPALPEKASLQTACGGFKGRLWKEPRLEAR